MDKTQEQYLTMQKRYYDRDASGWSIHNKDPVVGNYAAHDSFEDHDLYLFKNLDTEGKIALEYGCGPGRNLVRYKDRFQRIDGVDISPINIIKASDHLGHYNIPLPNLYSNDGKTLDMIQENTYDVVFSVICLQHICSYSVRYSILSECYRVLKPGGHFCGQIGFGDSFDNYHANSYDASATNGSHDVFFSKEEYLKEDLERIGYKDYVSDIRDPCCDHHPKWLWFMVQK
jgi:SAM-dependent methyltransferase